MVKTLKEISELIDGDLCGDGDLEITGVSGIKEAHPNEITFVANAKYRSEMEHTNASAIIIGPDIQCNGKATIRVADPYLSFVKVLENFSWRKKRRTEFGVHETAIIGENVHVGERVSIQAHAYIGDNVEIGDDTIISPLVYIGHDTKIGSGTLIYPRVTIREEIQIGDRVIIHCGAVIGSDGFGFATVSDRHHKIPQIGSVIIEDDVEIGANTTVDRATMTNGATVIKRGTKIDNLVQIAHNVVIGEDCRLAAQVGIAGSAVLKDRITVAGQAGVVGHLTIGEDTVIFAKSGVTKNTPAGSCVSGFPARPHAQEMRVLGAWHKLPSEFSQLQKRVAELESQLRQSDDDPFE